MKKLNKLVLSLSAASALFLTACAGDNVAQDSTKDATIVKNIDGSVAYKRVGDTYRAYKINPQVDKDKFAYGRTPTANEIKAWDIDIMPDGTGLPEGSGNIDDGEELYEDKCAMCHGDFGSGGKGYPTLSGGEHDSLKGQLLDAAAGDEPPVKTIGTYWPYASTLFWYVKTGMPFPHPMSLSADDTYSLTAYLLNVNEVTFKNGDEIEELNKDNFKDIKMPNADGFYPNVDVPEAKQNMKDLLAHPEKYGKGTRCMHDCIKGEVPVVHIKNGLTTGFNPPLSTERSWPQEETDKKLTRAEKNYNETCMACHANEAIGAPVVGDKELWNERLKLGIQTIYNHAINGFNAMPPKGGNMDLTDEEVKAIVDWMINNSK